MKISVVIHNAVPQRSQWLFTTLYLDIGRHIGTFSVADYLGSRFDIRVTTVSVKVFVHSIGIYPLKLKSLGTGRVYAMTQGRMMVERFLLDRNTAMCILVTMCTRLVLVGGVM